MKKRLGPQTRLYPMPIPLVCSGTGDEASMLAVAWMTIVGSKPPAVGMVIGRGHHTLELIRDCREFTVNFARASMAMEVDYCGLAKGEKVDKWVKTGLHPAPSAIVGPPLIEECSYHLECRVMSEIDLPTGSLMVIGEILEAHADEDVLDETGASVAVGDMDPLCYVTGIREYWSLGEKVADAYSIGKSLSLE
jgi:flavin reductase (DIM6/NTAB) family NADH-FMN oxidoreductase RutF